MIDAAVRLNSSIVCFDALGCSGCNCASCDNACFGAAMVRHAMAILIKYPNKAHTYVDCVTAMADITTTFNVMYGKLVKRQYTYDRESVRLAISVLNDRHEGIGPMLNAMYFMSEFIDNWSQSNDPSPSPFSIAALKRTILA